MKTLVFGSLNIDISFRLDHIVRPGETEASISREQGAGGKGENQAAALAKAGLEVYMAGRIGRDGEFLLELLKSCGVHTDYVRLDEGATGQALIQIDRQGQNSILLYPGGNERIESADISETLSHFGEGDLIVLQNEINRTAEIMKAAKERGLGIVLNPSPFNEKIAELPLDRVDIFFVNEIEGAGLAGMPIGSSYQDILESLCTRFPAAEIILTAGEAGSFYGKGTGGGAVREKAGIVKVAALDTTSAGDTFTGYFLAARAKGNRVKEALQVASKASAITVSRQGAMQSIPFAREVFEGIVAMPQLVL
jgi:ribokinase